MAVAEPLPRLDPAKPRLAALAEARRLDDRTLAARVGVTPRTARRWLSGRHLPTLADAVRLAEVLQVPVHVLAPTPAQYAREGLAALSAETRDRRTWSISKVHDYLRCSAYYYFRHVAEVPEPGKVELALGHAVHRAIEAGYVGATAPDGAAVAPRDVLRRDLQDRLPEGGAGPDAGEDAEPADFDALADEGEGLLALYRGHVAARVAPRAVEQRTEVDIAGVTFTVVSDVVTVDGLVRDTKVSKRRPSEADIAEDLQATAESLAYRQLYGEAERGVVFDYLLRHKKGPEYAEFPTTRTERDHARLTRIVDGVAGSVAREVFYPNPDTRYGCKSCPFIAACKATF